jgi:large subunit ribosomal protein L19
MAGRSRPSEDGKKQTGLIEFMSGCECKPGRAQPSREEEDSMNLLDTIEQKQLRTDLPAFNPGDTVKVHVKIKEGDKERIQVFEGVCIALKHGGNRTTFTVRKISFGHGVERIFPMHSRIIDKVEIVRHGRVRRAKLYYIRELRGKAARIREVKEVKSAAQ